LSDADSNAVLPTRNLLDIDIDVDTDVNVNDVNVDIEPDAQQPKQDTPLPSSLLSTPPLIDEDGNVSVDAASSPSASVSVSVPLSSPPEVVVTSTPSSTSDVTINSINEEMRTEVQSNQQLQEEDTTVDDTNSVENDAIEIPNLRKITKFAIPAIGVWLCSPLLSLIDTSTVGLLSGTAQQAALNPAVAVTDYGALLVAFMYTATTNLVAGARANEFTVKNKSNNSSPTIVNNDKPLTKKMLIHALQLSGYVGTLLGAALLVFGRLLLKSIIGNDAIDQNVFDAALRYVRIRALGMPAAVVIGSAQSACIGLQDIRSPMYVLLAAALVNLVGDLCFVPMANVWFGGAAGAAWATVLSQYAALGMFLKWMTSRPGRGRGGSSSKDEPINLTKAILELTGKSDEGKSRRKKFRRALQKLSMGISSPSPSTTTTSTGTNDHMEEESGNSNSSSSTSAATSSSTMKMKSILRPGRRMVSLFRSKTRPKQHENASKQSEFSVRGFLDGHENDLLQPPTIEEAKVFWPYFIPVTTTSVGRVSAYISMSHAVSSALGTMSMAANQVILSVFYCLTPIADSLNLTAQSFLPAIARREATVERANAIRQTTANFIKAGLIFSVGMVGAVGCIPFVSRYFTSDPSVVALVNSIVPVLGGIFASHGIMCSLEGVLLGQKDLNFLGKSYACFFFLIPYFMLRVKKAALQGAKDVGLSTLWSVFLCYNLVRSLMWIGRTKMLSNEAMKEATDAGGVEMAGVSE